jgi:hypothetical protein
MEYLVNDITQHLKYQNYKLWWLVYINFLLICDRDLSMRVNRKKGIIVIKNIMGFY